MGIKKLLPKVALANALRQARVPTATTRSPVGGAVALPRWMISTGLLSVTSRLWKAWKQRCWALSVGLSRTITCRGIGSAATGVTGNRSKTTNARKINPAPVPSRGRLTLGVPRGDGSALAGDGLVMAGVIGHPSQVRRPIQCVLERQIKLKEQEAFHLIGFLICDFVMQNVLEFQGDGAGSRSQRQAARQPEALPTAGGAKSAGCQMTSRFFKHIIIKTSSYIIAPEGGSGERLTGSSFHRFRQYVQLAGGLHLSK